MDAVLRQAVGGRAAGDSFCVVMHWSYARMGYALKLYTYGLCTEVMHVWVMHLWIMHQPEP